VDSLTILISQSPIQRNASFEWKNSAKVIALATFGGPPEQGIQRNPFFYRRAMGESAFFESFLRCETKSRAVTFWLCLEGFGVLHAVSDMSRLADLQRQF
jgi:hypothetical protein